MNKWIRFNYDEWVRLGSNADLRVNYTAGWFEDAEIFLCDLRGDYPIAIVRHGTEEDSLCAADFEGNIFGTTLVNMGVCLEMLVPESESKVISKEYWVVSYPVLINALNCGRRVSNTVYTSLEQAQRNTKGWKCAQIHKIVVRE
jgi:hypothetical protein